MIRFELYKELGLLIDQEEVSWVHPADEWQGNLYGVAGATEDDLPDLNDINISDADDVADVAKEVKAATGYKIDGIHTGGCAQGEYVDDSQGYFEVVYDHLGKDFLLISEMETLPLYLYWDGSNWKHIWLPEPDSVVEVDVEEMASLDTWDGNNYTHGGIGCHAEYYYIERLDGEPVKDKFLLRYWSQWEGVEPSGRIVSSEELGKIKAGERRKKMNNIGLKWEGYAQVDYETLYGEDIDEEQRLGDIKKDVLAEVARQGGDVDNIEYILLSNGGKIYVEEED